MTTAPTKSQQAAADVAALLRARNPLLWIVTREEARAEGHLFEAAASAGYVARFWDVAQGVTQLSGEPANVGDPDPASMLGYIRTAAGPDARAERGVWIMRDLAPWLRDLPGAQPCRLLRNLARYLPTVPRERAQAIIVLSTSADMPAELQPHATVIEWPMPDRAEIAAILDAAIAGLPGDIKAQAAPNGTRDAAIDAAIGLTGEEAQACYARSLVQLRRIDPRTVANEKKRIIAREKVLEWFDPIPGGLEAVGGLDQLKAWLQSRRNAYSPEARAYGLPAPKGVFLVGVPGCGKSLTAKAIATAWGVPLLKLDLGALKGKFVGESEANIRKAFAIIAAMGRCVVWVDEIEKALAGATSASADGGVSADALGAFLTWMQEKQGEAFVIATANDVSSLPPELLRKGRFDELFFVDLPTNAERAQIAWAALKAHGRDPNSVDCGAVADATADFTGSEIAALVPDALFAAFADGARPITAADLVKAARSVVPLAETAKAKIGALREWAKTKARRATSADTQQQQATGRTLDL